MYEWDGAKNAANIAKHGVDFQTAVLIFDGPVLTAEDSRFDYGEIRENSIGLVKGVLFLVVTHTDRRDIRRIISARPAKRQERERYVAEIRQGTQP